MEEKKVRIKTWMLVCMATVSLLIDGLQALLTTLLIGAIIGPPISAVAYFGFWVWFKILGVNFISNPKKMFAMLAGGVVEAIPVFGALPALTASVVAIATMTIAEDKGGIIGKVVETAQGKIKV